MFDHEFAAYIAGLGPQDRYTVQQALDGLRDAMEVQPPGAYTVRDRAKVLNLIEVLRAA